MKTNEFDKLLKDKFDEGEFAYNPDNWSRLSMQLPDKKPWNRSAVMLCLLSGIAACFALTFTINIWLQRSTNNIKSDGSIVTAKHIHATPTAKISSPIAAVVQSRDIPSPGSVLCPQSAHRRSIKTTTATSNKINNEPRTDLRYTAALTTRPHAQADKSIVVDRAPSANYTFEESRVEREEDAKDNRKVTISLAGGLNYGASNNGFALGATAQKRIGKKMYLEGNIAYVGNNISQQQQQQKSLNTFTPSNIAASVSAPNSVSAVSNMRYVQVTPSVGYNVLKHLSVGVGADFQQLVDNGASNYIMQGETVKELPSLDMGVVGKTEYMVNKSLSAGLMYREAVNNVLSGGGSKYFDRSYLQVQLKINVLGK